MQKLAFGLALGYALCIAILLLGVQPFAYLHDYSEWAYQGWILNQLWWGEINTPYQLARWPVPNSLSQIAIAVLNTLVSPVNASNIWLGGYCLLAPCIYFFAVRCSGVRDPGLVYFILLVTVAFGPGFWNGYLNFQYGLVMLCGWLLICGYDSPQSGKSESKRLATLLFSIAIFFAHAVPYAVLVVISGNRILFGKMSGWRGRLNLLLALLPSGLLMAWYASVKLAAADSATSAVTGIRDWFLYKIYTVAKQGPFHNFVTPDGKSILEDFHPLFLAGVAINFAVVLVMAGWLLSLLWQRKKPIAQPFSLLAARHNSSVIAVLTLVTLAVLFLIPGQNTLGVVNLGERFLIPAIMLALLTLSCGHRLLVLWAALCVIGGSLTLGSYGWLSIGGDQIYQSQIIQSHRAQRDGDSGGIYAHTRHKLFNHRVLLYADRSRFLLGRPPVRELMPIPDSELATGPLYLER